jgi:alpha-galactosidase
MKRLTRSVCLSLAVSAPATAQWSSSPPTSAGTQWPSPPSSSTIAARPYSGWSSFSQQTLTPEFLTQANMEAQSDTMRSSGLQAHGYDYINVDSGWMGGFDEFGRPIPNLMTFPDIKAMYDHIHANGQKGGIYWIPGVEEPAVAANYPIMGTPYHIRDILAEPYRAGNSFGGDGTSPYHYKIDFSKPGAQEYMDSVVALFASWGVDFIKLDAVTPGSYSDDLRIDNRADVAAWSRAIAKTGRPIWFTVSWQLSKDYLDVWQRFSNARRIDDDVECEGRCATLTNWPRSYKRFRDLPNWQDTAGPFTGWNDLDALDIVNGSIDGLTTSEKMSTFSIWAMANSPMYLGGDLTKLTEPDRRIVTNDEALRLARSGRPGREKIGGDHPVWVSDQGGGVFYVAFFNMNDTPEIASFNWGDVGLVGALVSQDVWTGAWSGASFGTYTTRLEGHGVRLLKVWAAATPAPRAIASYEAESATLAGGAAAASCLQCSGGTKVGGLSVNPASTVRFADVRVARAGGYLMQVDSLTQGLRSFHYTVNDGPARTFNAGGGSFASPSSNRLPVCLKAGVNTISFSNATSYGPDLDRIVILGDGRSRLPTATTFEAENATLGAGVTAGFSNFASGLSKAGNVGGALGREVTFANVVVPATGDYQLEVDYMTNGPRSFQVSINGARARAFTVTGSSFDDPAVAMYKVRLKAGTNVIRFGNDAAPAPDLDRIVIAPWIGERAMTASTTQPCG